MQGLAKAGLRSGCNGLTLHPVTDTGTSVDESLTEDVALIEALGGTVATAQLCQVTSQAVSQWRTAGIPKPRRMYLELLRKHRSLHAEVAQHGQHHAVAVPGDAKPGAR
jgi:hypothetical protein